MSLPAHSWIITLDGYILSHFLSQQAAQTRIMSGNQVQVGLACLQQQFSSCNMSDLSTSYKLQPFLLLSKSVKGSANAKLISDALAAPGVYVFSELAQAPNVLEVCYKLPFNCITNLTVLLDRHRRFPK